MICFIQSFSDLFQSTDRFKNIWRQAKRQNKSREKSNTKHTKTRQVQKRDKNIFKWTDSFIPRICTDSFFSIFFRPEQRCASHQVAAAVPPYNDMKFSKILFKSFSSFPSSSSSSLPFPAFLILLLLPFFVQGLPLLDSGDDISAERNGFVGESALFLILHFIQYFRVSSCSSYKGLLLYYLYFI